jgi:hypothetical protein
MRAQARDVITTDFAKLAAICFPCIGRLIEVSALVLIAFGAAAVDYTCIDREPDGNRMHKVFDAELIPISIGAED